MPDHQWFKEALLIIFALGGLEWVLWSIDRRGVLADRKELSEQTKILEDIATSLIFREAEIKEEAHELDTVVRS